MHSLASFIMRGRWQAALAAALATVLSLLLPPILIVSAASVAFATLRWGSREGALVVVIGGCAILVLTFPLFAGGAIQLALIVVLLFWLPSWLLAVVLRATISLALTLAIAAMLGALAVLIFYVALNDPVLWWTETLNAQLKPMFSSAGLIKDETAFNDFIEFLALIMPGIIAASFLTNILLGLLLGRWWQALLYNPGGFRKEFHTLRLGRKMALTTVIITGIALVIGLPLFINLLWVLGAIYVIQSFALVHGLVFKAGLARGWLIGFYVLMTFVPQLLSFLCLLSVLDAWVDFRSRIKAAPGRS